MYITTFSHVLCDSNNWCFTLRDTNGLMVLGKRVLSTTLWSKRDEVEKNWRKLYNEEL